MYIKKSDRDDLIEWANEFIEIWDRTPDDDDNRLYNLEQAGYSLAHRVKEVFKDY